mgnify:CR=1 FL=1
MIWARKILGKIFKSLVRNNLRRLQTLVTKKDAQCEVCTPMQGSGVRILGILQKIQSDEIGWHLVRQEESVANLDKWKVTDAFNNVEVRIRCNSSA